MFDGSIIVMNVLFALYYELEERNFSYEDEGTLLYFWILQIKMK